MILDKQNTFSDDQEPTTTAASTNIIDLGADGSKVPNPNIKAFKILVQITLALVTGTSLAVSLQTDSDEAFGSPVTLYTTAAIATADLIAGYKFAIPSMPITGVERYIRLMYTIIGTYNAGTIYAGVILDEQVNN